jgi:ArsR family transcriptional regulator, cadmium/lead-responsive transcriptional repressor
MTMHQSRPAAPAWEPEGLTAAACLFRALSDPSRLGILRHLQLGPHRVVDLVDHLGLAQSTVSQHLACLRDCGLVESRPRGRSSEYSIAEGVPIKPLLAAAEQVLQFTGEAVVLCPNSGIAGRSA